MQELIYKNFGDEAENLSDRQRAMAAMQRYLARVLNTDLQSLADSMARTAIELAEHRKIQTAVQMEDGALVVDVYLAGGAYGGETAELLDRLMFLSSGFSLSGGEDYDCAAVLQFRMFLK